MTEIAPFSRRRISLAVAVSILAATQASAAPPATPTPSRGCPDQVAALLPKLEPLVEEFREELRTARGTSRISLGPQISRLEDVQRRTRRLTEWPESLCGYAVRDKLDAVESYDVNCLKGFLENRKPCEKATEEALWSEAFRQLHALKDLVARTKR